MNDQNYIQYHNADKLGYYPSVVADFEVSVDSLSFDSSIKYDSWIYTKKKTIEKAINKYCFLIVGKTEDKVKKYFLWSYFKIENLEEENGFYNVLGNGFDFSKPILLNELENFNDFKIFCGNFGLGFQNVDNHIFSEALISFLPDLYKKNQIIDDDIDIEYSRLTTKQYQEVIINRLSNRQIEILQILYNFPNSSTTAIQLAEALNYKSFHGANRQIGALGEAFYKHSNVEPPKYDDDKFAYYYFIGEYQKNIGWIMWDELKEALEKLELVKGFDSKNTFIDRLPTELMPFEEKKYYEEGKITEVFVNRYERDKRARLECIKYYGAICQGCGFDFEEKYGEVARGFIHVHHIVSLASIASNHKVDPILDLIPLCANCHSVVHLPKQSLTIDELKKLIKK